MKTANLIKLAVIVVFAAIICYSLIRYIQSLPTKQEKVLLRLMEQFERGDYIEASTYCQGNSLFEVIDNSTVVDTDGQEIHWKRGGYRWDEATVQGSIEVYVKYHLRRMEFVDLATQELDDGANAVVSFQAEMSVADYTQGDLLAPALHNGRMTGECHMTRNDDGEYKLVRFDVTLVTLGNVSLKHYLREM